MVPGPGGTLEISLGVLSGCDEADALGNVRLGWLVGMASAGSTVTSSTKPADEGNEGKSRGSTVQMTFGELHESKLSALGPPSMLRGLHSDGKSVVLTRVSSGLG